MRRREATRERKAEAAAKVERAIERELIERLRSGAYGDRPLNVEEGIWKKVLRGLERQGEGERDEDLDEGVEEEEGEVEYEREAEADVEYVSDADESEDQDAGDLEEWVGGESGDEEGTEDDGDEGGGSDGSEEGSQEEDFTTNKPAPGVKRKGGKLPPPKRLKKDPRVEIEYEDVQEPLREAVLAR